MTPDHYQALGVHPEADAADIRAAYLRLMRAHHPDRRPDDAHAHTVARRANLAWHILGDEQRRGAYDRLRHARAHPATSEAVPSPTALLRSEAIRRQAYSADRVDYRRAFSRACLRVGVAVLLIGMALLLAVGGG